MKAIVIQTEQENHPLVWQHVPAPTHANNEVLVDVYAAALNRADLMQRAGSYPPPPGTSDVLGLEVAGCITAVGANVMDWNVGDRVCALLPGGGYAEQAVVPVSMLMPIPPDWSYEQAAAVPEVFLTAFVNLFMEANLQAGETLLIHGGASGVGTAAIQLAAKTGARVLVTAGTDEKVARCKELGAELAINYKMQDFAEAVKIHTAGAGVDVILDMVGAEYFARNLALLKQKGRIVFIAALSGTQTTLNLGILLRRRLRLIGSVLRGRSLAEKEAIKEAFMARFWSLLEQGTIQPVIDSIFPIQQAEEAHNRMAANKNIGKIVLRVREPVNKRR